MILELLEGQKETNKNLTILIQEIFRNNNKNQFPSQPVPDQRNKGNPQVNQAESSSRNEHACVVSTRNSSPVENHELPLPSRKARTSPGLKTLPEHDSGEEIHLPSSEPTTLLDSDPEDEVIPSPPT